MCAAILAARLQCGTLAGGGFALVAGGDCARRGVAHAASIVCSIYVYERSIRKEKKEYSIVEKGDKKVTVSVGDPKNTPAHCTH